MKISRKSYRGRSFYKLMGAFFVVITLCASAISWQFLAAADQSRAEKEASFDAMAGKAMENEGITWIHFQTICSRLAESNTIRSLAEQSHIPLDSPEGAAFWETYADCYWRDMPSTGNTAYVYFKKSGRCMGMGGPQDDPLISGEIMEEFGLDDDLWKRIKFAGEEPFTANVKTIKMNNQLRLFAREIVPGVVFFVGTKTDYVSEQMRMYYLPVNAQLLSMTVNDECIEAFPGSFVKQFPYTFAELGSMEEKSSQVVDGLPYFMYHKEFGDGTVQQIVLIPDTVNQGRTESIVLVIAITVSIWLLVGGCFSYLFAATLYKPVERMMMALPEKEHTKKNASEFQLVSRTLESLVTQNRTYEELLAIQNRRLADNLFIRLLKGELPFTEDIAAVLQNASFPTDLSCYTVLLLQADSVTEEAVPQAEWAAFCISFWMNRGVRAFWAEEQDIRIALLDTGGKTLEESLLPAAADFQEELTDGLHLVCSAAFSRIHMTLEELPEAYQEAVQVMDYCLLAGIHGESTIYEDIANLLDNAGPDDKLMEQTHKLANFIQAEKFDAAASLLQELFQGFQDRFPYSAQSVQSHVSYVLDTLLLSLGCTDLDAAALRELAAKNRQRTQNLETLCSSLCANLKGLQSQTEKNNSRANKAEQIVRYIQENYSDTNLSASTVAERFHMGLSSLSMLFKQEMNIGFLDFLHKCRIDQAKHLIQTTDLTIGEISARVGYANTITMNRAFRRYEGVAPSWYRQKTES
ncbi:helix-turn-helix domain-containing protein [Clostridium sp. D33t1_170424_F3]|uniref:helix-turn-helix domain-containing protein n=1 Tax=Clostridium sp. D33t1_170424_F3 TaxID=2787099 RepID=UPI0018AACED5|nr:helix-turn-helix domain-containing protein [Clostridium sp. D33t1_170424_F3]